MMKLFLVIYMYIFLVTMTTLYNESIYALQLLPNNAVLLLKKSILCVNMTYYIIQFLKCNALLALGLQKLIIRFQFPADIAKSISSYDCHKIIHHFRLTMHAFKIK